MFVNNTFPSGSNKPKNIIYNEFKEVQVHSKNFNIIQINFAKTNATLFLHNELQKKRHMHYKLFSPIFFVVNIFQVED